MAPEKNCDLLLQNGCVLPMDGDRLLIPNGYVAVKGAEIVRVGSLEAESAPAARRTIDARGGLIMPGLINCHTHAAMTCLRGLADDLPLDRWLNDHIFPAEAKLDADKVYWGALLACAEMIQSGTTCFCDMYLFEESVAAAARDAGMRAVVGEVLYDFPSPNYGDIADGFAYTREMIARWQGDALVSVAVEPHSAYLCSPDLLQEAFELAASCQVPMVIHLAETRSEIERVRAKSGRTPVGLMADLQVLGANVVACHCVVLSEEDIAQLQHFDVKVVHNPESNMKLASGIAPVPALLAAGICVGLGTDGCASNNDLDMLLEMGSAARLHKAGCLDPTVLDAQATLRMATIDAAQVLGLEGRTGSLTPGKYADIIVVDTAQPHLAPMYHPFSHLVYAARGSDVTTSVIHGRVVMQDRVIETIDVATAAQTVAAIARELR